MADEPQQQPSKRLKRTKPEWRVFPPTKRQATCTFHDGDAVLIKSKDTKAAPVRGTIVSVNNDGGGEVQVLVEEKQESFGPKERKRLMPYFGINPTIIITPETNYFRQMVHQVEATDAVLEIGCSTGETSRLLIPLSNSWVGLDTSQQMIDQCKSHMKENCHVSKVDALIDPKRALEESRTCGEPNVIFVDIGGNRECINVLRMVSWVLDSFGPRLVVVKSRELVQSVRSSASVDSGTGLIADGDTWYRDRQQRRALPKHPLRAPLVLSPKDGLTPICRYHNYHKDGCSKEDRCELDHNHCHACQQLGHIATHCPTLGHLETQE
jgi:SAM-dependent methyltransferase